MRFPAFCLLVCAGAAFLFSGGGCTNAHYRKSADDDAYRIIKQKSKVVGNMDPAFNIDTTNLISLTDYPTATKAEEFLGTEGKKEVQAKIISLEKALEIAVKHNRSYQSRKEQLYLEALGLALSRHAWTPIFSGVAHSDISDTAEGVDSMVENRKISDSTSASMSWLIRDIGKLTAAFSTDLTRFVIGNPQSVYNSQVSAILTRPLLRNAGFKAEMEALTQAERNMVYNLRNFVQYRRDFSVQLATDYYQVLSARDAARNSYLNLQSSHKSGERTRALAQEGLVTQADLGRLEQQELDSQNSWISAVNSYQQALDNFKLQDLGLPVSLPVVLDDHELARLVIQHPSVTVEDSIKVALLDRLDYMTAVDRHADAVRQIPVTASALRPQADLTASAGFVNPNNARNIMPIPEPRKFNWSAGLDVDLPFDRTSERNNYRAALIQEKQAARDLEQQEDQIKLQIRDSWRTLEQAKSSYEISEIGVKLAARRVEEQNLLAELGRAKAQDQVDAQNDYVRALNSRTQAIVGHTTARLTFWNRMGILYIKDNGQWQEINSGGTK